MDKPGVRSCVSNMASILKDLLHAMDNDLESKCRLSMQLLKNNIKSMDKLLDLDKKERK